MDSHSSKHRSLEEMMSLATAKAELLELPAAVSVELSDQFSSWVVGGLRNGPGTRRRRNRVLAGFSFPQPLWHEADTQARSVTVSFDNGLIVGEPR
jgi:hypothetical protein